MIDPTSCRPESIQLRVELESEGGWVPIGELARLPGGEGPEVTREEALAAVEEIAWQLLADGWIEDERRGVQELRPVRIPVGRPKL